jgi:flagellin
LLKTQVDTTLKAAYDAFIAAPDGLADDVTFKAGTVTAKKAAGGADGYFTLAAGHGIDNGQRVRFYDASVATGISTTVDYYLKVDAANANKFTIHTDAALTSAAVDPVADDAAKLHMMSYGNYDKLKMLRTELANTAMEWEQKELATVDRTKQDWSGAAVDSVKQVDDITIAAGSAAGDNYNVTINGKTLATAVAHDTNVATTGAALAAAINADAELGALVSASADGAGKVTLTSEVAGNSYTLEVTSNLHSISSANVTQNVTGVDASKAVTKSWQDVYDFWQTRTGNTWSGVRAHVDAVDRQAKDIVNQGSLTDDLATQYKNMYSDIKSYVYNNGAGIAVTDRSDGGSYQLKGADVSFITDAIDNSTDTYAIKEDLTKTNGETYAKNVSSLINDLAGTRAYVGANISRLNMVSSQLAVYGENLGAANSRIADVDVAVESANYAKNQILVQSGTAMLAQANVLPQYALQLLQ